MNLTELIDQNLSYGQLKNLWLVFDPSFIPALESAHDEGDFARVSPIALNNGKAALCADLLTEINGGIYTKIFSRLDSSKFDFVEVLTVEEITPLFIQNLEE